jgi:hypothetical protein
MSRARADDIKGRTSERLLVLTVRACGGLLQQAVA